MITLSLAHCCTKPLANSTIVVYRQSHGDTQGDRRDAPRHILEGRFHMGRANARCVSAAHDHAQQQQA